MEEYMLQISSSRSHKIVNQSEIVAVRGLISNYIYQVLSTPKTGEFRLKVAKYMIRSIWTRRSVAPPTLAIYVMFNILRMLSIFMSNIATSFNTWVLSLTHTHLYIQHETEVNRLIVGCWCTRIRIHLKSETQQAPPPPDWRSTESLKPFGHLTIDDGPKATCCTARLLNKLETNVS